MRGRVTMALNSFPSTAARRSARRSTLAKQRHAYQWIALSIAAVVVVQFFLAGLGVFGAQSFEAHRQVGFLLHTAAMVGLVAAVVRPRTARAIGSTLALLVALTIQIALPGLRDDLPWLAAFHPLLALAILSLAVRTSTPVASRHGAELDDRPHSQP